MKKLVFTLILSNCILLLSAQNDTLERQNNGRKRLDFAKTYFEFGASFTPSFTGKTLTGNQITSIDYDPTANQYLTWGAFHFWGYAEFFVTFPLGQLSSDKNKDYSYELRHSVTTGARIYPWRMQEKKICPYIGLNWGALDFEQKSKSGEKQTGLSKDFLLNFETGFLYNYKSFALRLGVNYFSETKWNYPISKTQKTEIKTPPLNVQLGLLYTYDDSGNTDKETVNKWNGYPEVSGLSYGAKKFGDFFVGAGPSISYSLKKSDYNIAKLPYLKEKLTSKMYFDIAAGYHFNKANMFTALSFRNPKFETEGYDDKQTIKKNSFALEINKFLIDYTGFAPYIGVNVAYDQLKYEERINGENRTLNFNGRIEPGFTFGWDIVPGKTDEALILRTNLRWYPWSEFELDGKNFNFSQLEYNLIQLVFYPERLKKKKK